MNRPFIEAVEPRLLLATFVVTTTADSGAGSLRQAILSANANDTPSPTDDDVEFNIPGTGIHTINLLSPLPTITGNLNVDATSQPGYDTTHTPVIELNGAAAGAAANGLTIASTGPVAASNVLGLIINRFGGNGVVISGEWNSVAQCYIGTDSTGTAAGPGNGGHGILVTGDNNLVAENTIAFNANDGAAVATGSVGNTLAPNNFFSNGGLGIDLGDNGPTTNDADDLDDGPNRLQNAPVITGVTAAASPARGVNVTGTINTTPNTLIEITLYASPTNEGEGRAYLYVVPPVETDANGNASFTANLPTARTTDWITATATSYAFTSTSAETNTSEFSAPVTSGASPVTELYVRGTTWAPGFESYLAAQGMGDVNLGYRVDNQPATDVLSWINLDEVVVRYPAPPPPAAAPTPTNVALHGVRSDYTVTSVTTIDAQTYVLHLDRPLGNLPTPPGGVNGDRIVLTFTGGLVPARTLNVLQGDVDKSGTVVAQDFSEVKKRFFRSTTAPGPAGDTQYTPLADIDGNGSILANDFSEVKKRFFNNLPPAAAATSAPSPRDGITGDLLTGRVIL